MINPRYAAVNTGFTLADYLIFNEDPYRPPIKKDYSQQIDPYSIYDLVCTDFENELITNKPGMVNQPPIETMKNFLAIQAYSPFPIPFNYSEIIKGYT